MVSFFVVFQHPFTLIRPQEIMCDDTYCSVFDNGALIYHDSNHITAICAASDNATEQISIDFREKGF